MPKVVTLYFVTYIVFLSNIQPYRNKRHNLLFIEKYKKLYKLAKYQFFPRIIFIY
jgi:hypothetical protein